MQHLWPRHATKLDRKPAVRASAFATPRWRAACFLIRSQRGQALSDGASATTLGSLRRATAQADIEEAPVQGTTRIREGGCKILEERLGRVLPLVCGLQS